MAQDLSEKELLRMEVEQLKKEVKNPRDPVSEPPVTPLGFSFCWKLRGDARQRMYCWVGVG